MCLLCVASRWSRRVAIMLPRLVMAISILWAASQLFPQAFFFEVHSPRLAWVGVLLISLVWYELVMPKVSAWRARRVAILRQKRRAEEQEAARWRKKATRRCRNCYAAYKDQNPGSGKFMCTYCGHVSKRPVLDLPVGAQSSSSMFSLPVSAAEFFSVNAFLAVRSPLSWYGRGSLVMPSWEGGRRWIGNAPWIDGVSWGVSNCWFGSQWPGSALNFANGGFGWTGSGNLMENVIFGAEKYASGDSYFGVSWFLIRVVSQLLFCALWLWRKLSRASHAGEDDTAKAHGVSPRRGADLSVPVETRSEKARRKAEERRLARLEREYLEAEEKKQREEVARLVEERRRQKDKKLGAGRQIAREVSEEKQMVIRGEEESETRQGRKENLLMKEKLMEQCMEMGNKRTSGKTLKPDKRNGSNEVEPEVKIEAKSCSKWASISSQGSAKSGVLLVSKTVTATKNNATGVLNHMDCSGQTIRGDTTNISSSSSTTSSSLSGNPTQSSSSSWNPESWNNAWCKQTSRVCDDEPKKLDMIENSLDTSRDDDVICNNIVFDFNIGNSQQQLTGLTSSSSDIGEMAFPSSSYFVPGDWPQDLWGRGHRMNDMEIKAGLPSVYSSKPIPSATRSCEGSGISRTYSGHEPTTDSLVSNHRSSEWLDFNVGRDANDIPSLWHRLPCSLMYSSRNNLDGDTSSLLPMENAGVAHPVLSRPLAATSANAKAVSQVGELRNVTENGVTTQDHDSMYELEANFPYNMLFQQRHDVKHSMSSRVLHTNEEHESLSSRELQMDEEPESLLPSSLFSFEESNNDGLSLEDSLGARSNLQSGMCDWDDMDIYRIVPPEFVDCITHSLMEDPVITADGHSYERSAIEAWLKSHDTSPITGEVLPPLPVANGSEVDKTLRPNHILRGQIMEYKERVSRFGLNHAFTNYGWTPAEIAMKSGVWPMRDHSRSSPSMGQYGSWTPGPVATTRSSTLNGLIGCHDMMSGTTATKSYLWPSNDNRTGQPFIGNYY